MCVSGVRYGILRTVQTLVPPSPSPRLFWALVLSTVGSFVLGRLVVMAIHLPTAVVMSDMGLARVLGVEALLALLWVPILRRRGWSLACVTVNGTTLDVPLGVWLFGASYVAYALLFWTLAVILPTFSEVATAIPIVGAPSLWMVVVVSCVNPVAEELFYLGFITNVLKPNGSSFAITAGLLARAALHLYQGPIRSCRGDCHGCGVRRVLRPDGAAVASDRCARRR